MPWSAHATSSYLAIWASDKEKRISAANTDFLAIIDADPRSPTYGKVVNTASLERVAGANLLNDLGLTEALGLTAKYNLITRHHHGISSTKRITCCTSRSRSGGTAISIWAG